MRIREQWEEKSPGILQELKERNRKTFDELLRVWMVARSWSFGVEKMREGNKAFIQACIAKGVESVTPEDVLIRFFST